MKDGKLENAKIKRRFRTWMLEAKGTTEATVDGIFRAISLYENIFNNESFSNFNRERALKFKEQVRKKKHNNKPISANSIRTYLIHLKSFFEWICTQPGYKKIPADSLEYLKVSKKESRIAAQLKPRKFPLIDYIRKLIQSIKIDNDVDKRDCAVISFSFLTGMRDSAIVSLPIKCVDEEKLYVYQDPNQGVKTKFSKTIPSKIFCYDDEMLQIVKNWIKYLKEKGFSANDPVFPRSKLIQAEDGYSFIESQDIEPVYWNSTNSLRKIFKIRSENAGLPYYPPHTFRHSCIYYALEYANSGDEIKAISQNFGHEDIGTTLSIYAQYTPEHLFEVLDNIEYRKHNDKNDIEMKMKVDLIYKKLVDQEV